MQHMSKTNEGWSTSDEKLQIRQQKQKLFIMSSFIEQQYLFIFRFKLYFDMQTESGVNKKVILKL